MPRTKLLEILKNHGVRAYLRGGRIFAEDFGQDEAGTVSERVVELPSTLKAVRAFLGY
jgi:hypothetical protein